MRFCKACQNPFHDYPNILLCESCEKRIFEKIDSLRALADEIDRLRAELDAANAKADRLADALQIGREYAAEAVAANKRNYGERLVSRQQLDIDYLAKIDAALADHDASRDTAAKEGRSE